MIPDRVREAACRAQELVGSLSSSPTPEQPGSLSVASASCTSGATDSLSRLVAVLHTDEQTKTVMIQLTTNEIENATDLDLILPAGAASVPFALTIESELLRSAFR